MTKRTYDRRVGDVVDTLLDAARKEREFIDRLHALEKDDLRAEYEKELREECEQMAKAVTSVSVRQVAGDDYAFTFSVARPVADVPGAGGTVARMVAAEITEKIMTGVRAFDRTRDIQERVSL